MALIVGNLCFLALAGGVCWLVFARRFAHFRAHRRRELFACSLIALLSIGGFGLAHVGMNASWTGHALFTDLWWLAFGGVFACALLSAHLLLRIQRTHADQVVLPAAALLMLLGLLNVYVAETRDANAYVTTVALPSIRSYQASAANNAALALEHRADILKRLASTPNELTYERDPRNRSRDRFATVLDGGWLGAYNRVVRRLRSPPALPDAPNVHEVRLYRLLRKQLLMTVLGLLSVPGVIFLWSRRGRVRLRRRSAPVVALSALLLAIGAVAALRAGGGELPALAGLSGPSITVFDVLRVGVVVVLALSFAARDAPAARGRQAERLGLLAAVLASLGLLLVDHGSGVALLAIIVLVVALGTGPRWRKVMPVSGAVLAFIAPPAVFSVGVPVPQSARVRLEMWADPWGSFQRTRVERSAGGALRRIVAYRLGAPAPVEGAFSDAPPVASQLPPAARRPLASLIQADVGHLEQELWFRLGGVRGSGDVVRPFVPGSDPADKLVLFDAETVWSELGGYTPHESVPALTTNVEQAIADVQADARRFGASLLDTSRGGPPTPRALVAMSTGRAATQTDDFQLQRALFALRAGGLFGVGLGMNRAEALPGATQDVPFASMGEALGLCGVALMLCLGLLITTRGMRWALHARGRRSGLLIAALAASFGLQVLIEAAGSTGLVPFSGLTFPFLSRSGTALIANCVALGLLMAAAAGAGLDASRRSRARRGVHSFLTSDAGFPAALGVVLVSVGCLQLTGLTLIPGAIARGLPGRDSSTLNAGNQWDVGNYRIVPGTIVDRRGRVLATTDSVGSARTYPNPALARSLAHALVSLDITFRDRLIEPVTAPGSVGAGASGPVGPTLVTSIDADLQQALDAAYDGGAAEAGLQVSGLRGAAVVLDARNGRILGLMSRPTFSPDELSRPWAWAAAEAADRRAGFPYRYLNRVISAHYPPGSIFKTITAAGVLESGLHTVHSLDFDYRHGPKGPRPPDGLLQLGRWHELTLPDGPPITDGNHPQLKNWDFSVERAYAWSDNVAFAEMGLQLGPARLLDFARRFGFEHSIDVPGLGLSYSTVDNDVGKPLVARAIAKTKSNLARTAFGQAQVRATPLQMALVAAGIANGGTVMQPRLVEGWMAPNGSWISRTPARVLFNTRLSKQTIDGLHDIMRAAATYGWARGARVNERNANPGVAAKTGSAEWSEQRDAAHSWLIGYFPAEAPRIALALVVERGGLAPIVATRIARRVFASKAVADYVRSQG
jgi:peptidoglycan glycosyltransferase